MNGACWSLAKTPFGTGFRLEAAFTRVSAASLYRRSTWLSSRQWNLYSSSRTARHLRVQAAFLLHHLVDDELRISSDLEAANPKLECDPEPVEEGFVLRDIVGGLEV